MDGTWSPINASPIATLTITGEKVTTTGRLACPGAISEIGSRHPVITMSCAGGAHADRKRGAVIVLDPGSLAINWEGPAWGGLVDSLRRRSEARSAAAALTLPRCPGWRGRLVCRAAAPLAVGEEH
ncbi:hypothetical protein [Actinomadura litoris]|uniref:Uncharacterized protein n=1 Tax=Actinomadura litoris TaxID=2678616 RepID=A0A7K1L908_9ACTN|nr:hypothetical protein [Actinomadura litoris]MUN40908.1 hypothetical protein [Actinomadura litoris]